MFVAHRCMCRYTAVGQATWDVPLARCHVVIGAMHEKGCATAADLFQARYRDQACILLHTCAAVGNTLKTPHVPQLPKLQFFPFRSSLLFNLSSHCYQL